MTAIFDTHAHYDDDAFNDDREQLLAALPGQGIAGWWMWVRAWHPAGKC